MQNISENLFFWKVTNWQFCIFFPLNFSALVGKYTPETSLSMQKSDLKVSEIIIATILGAASLF